MSVVKTQSGLSIPYEVADGITLAVLQDHLSYLRQELKEHLEEGKWMHPEDVIKSREEYIPALETLVKFFGGDDA
jgi:hypothetical protein